MIDFDFLLLDRVDKIRSIDQLYDLRNNSYISFSGGKDSVVLSFLIDLALPNNNIPRVFLNTGIEFIDIVKFVRDLSLKDSRFIIVNSGVNIPTMLSKFGYPFKSKEYSKYYSLFQNGSWSPCLEKYYNKESFGVPLSLKYMWSEPLNFKISDKCCYKLKKEPALKWAKEHLKSVVLTGMRRSERGQRSNIDCLVFDKDNKLSKFHPLAPVNDDFENFIISNYHLSLCRLYLPPFNFERTGCKGCPFNIHLQKELDLLSIYLPTEKNVCERIWAPVYAEYRLHNFRLKNDLKLF